MRSESVPRPPRTLLQGILAAVRHRQGRLLGRMENLGFKLQEEATLNTLTEEVVKSSEIEGEKLDQNQVRRFEEAPFGRKN